MVASSKKNKSVLLSVYKWFIPFTYVFFFFVPNRFFLIVDCILAITYILISIMNIIQNKDFNILIKTTLLIFSIGIYAITIYTDFYFSYLISINYNGPIFFSHLIYVPFLAYLPKVVEVVLTRIFSKSANTSILSLIYAITMPFGTIGLFHMPASIIIDNYLIDHLIFLIGFLINLITCILLILLNKKMNKIFKYFSLSLISVVNLTLFTFSFYYFVIHFGDGYEKTINTSYFIFNGHLIFEVLIAFYGFFVGYGSVEDFYV